MDNNEIKFPRRLDTRGLKDLFAHIGQELPGWIEYRGEISGYIGLNRFEKDWKMEERLAISEGYICRRDALELLHFNLTTERKENEVLYERVVFDTIPGYSKNELLRTAIANPEMMENVRRIVQRYFSKT
jgi:hypothetical protein